MAIPDPVTLGTPVISSRAWCSALAPSTSVPGDWNYITYSYQLHDTGPGYWVILKGFTTQGAAGLSLATSTSGIYPMEQQTYRNQLRAADGKIYFAGFQNQFWYYDPADEAIHSIGVATEVPPENTHTSYIPYSSCFDQSGRYIYWGTQESGSRSPAVFRVDTTASPPTLSTMGYVGSSLLAFTTYGYYIAVDANGAVPYAYVCVGKSPWQLWALNLNTGVGTKLYEVTSTGNMQFAYKPEGITAIIDTDLGKADNVRTQWWCIDGALYAYTAGYNPATLPFTTRTVTQYSNPNVSPPGLDNSSGVGLLGWRPNGSTGAYTYISYNTPNAAAVQINQIIDDGTGTVWGDAQQYQGWFSYNTHTGTTTWLGVSTGLVDETLAVRVGGYIYFSGYPNLATYKFDPTQSWNGTTNPVLVGYFHTSNTTKHSGVFVYSAINNRLYAASRRDREGQGGGVGYYDIATNTFGGTFNNLNFLNPVGFAVLERAGLLVYSGTVISDPAFPGQTPTTAQLVIYDMNANELRRYTVVTGMLDTGILFPTAVPGIVFGMTKDTITGSSTGVMYRYDVINGVLSQSAPLPAAISTTTVGSRQAGTYMGITQSTGGRSGTSGVVYAVLGTNLYAINPEDLTYSVVSTASGMTWLAEMASSGHRSTTPTPGLFMLKSTQIGRMYCGPQLAGHSARKVPV